MPMAAAAPLTDRSRGHGLLLTALALLALGVVVVHSAAASVGEPPAWYARREVRHTVFAALAALVLLVGWRFDYRRLAGRSAAGRLAPRSALAGVPLVPAIGLALALLAAALVFVPGTGWAIGGYHRWIRLGPARYAIGFQPSELVKLALVVFLAAWLTRPGADVRSWRTLAPAAGVVALSLAPVITEDFGTAAVICIVAGVMLLLAGAPLRYLLGLAAAGAGAFYVMVVRVPHRWARIVAMMDPWAQGNPSTYQPRQSLVGILSGGWTGKGPGAGLQKMFLPESATDFIFSVYCEEWGFAGAILLIALVMLWIWHARRAALAAADDFGRLLAGSLGFLIAFQAVLHIAVDLVAAPPTGMSFPFISAGGTSLVMMAAAASLVASVAARGRA
jgi:cell division protein FtsW